MERQKWLDSLKVGGEVALQHGRWIGRWFVISKVTAIRKSSATRRGTITVGSYEYWSDGHAKSHHAPDLQPVTADVHAAIADREKRHAALEVIRGVLRWHEQPTDRLVKIAAILSEK